MIIQTNYFCNDCFKTYTEYYEDGKFWGLETDVYGKCDDCGGDLKVD